VIAALYVEPGGPYFGLPNVDPWPKERDARKYRGPWPVVAHPDCARWGRYWSGGPSAKVRRVLGDDEGCFAAALMAVRNFGGVLEHPAHSKAFRAFGLDGPEEKRGWHCAGDGYGYVCHVEQGHYGHPARKATWLYVRAIHPGQLPQLKWGTSSGVRIEEGFHSKEERARARYAGVKPVKRISQRELIHTPIPFREVLLRLAGLGRLG